MNWINDIKKDLNEINTNNKTLKEFGFILGLMFILLSIFIFKHFSTIGISLGSIFIAISLIKPKILKSIYFIWMIISIAIGWWITKFILLLVFVLAIFPTALILRLTKKNLLQTKINQKTKTYWIPIQTSKNNTKTLEKQF